MFGIFMNLSPVLLVQKKDGTYGELNCITGKNKVLILTIDDLLDELRGAAVFSKIDLRVSYHHIRGKNDDVHKTTFELIVVIMNSG